MCFTLRKAHAGGGGTFQEVEIIIITIILGTPPTHPPGRMQDRTWLSPCLSYPSEAS